MDRVDLWLNARQGWSREVLTWVILAPMAVGVGLGGRAVAGEAWWIPAPLALIVLGQLARRVLPRRGGRTARYSRGGLWSAPEFSWRRMAGALVFFGSWSVLFITIGLDGSPTWHHWHRTFDLLYIRGNGRHRGRFCLASRGRRGGRLPQGAVLVKIYTRKGDGGQTGIWGGVRLAKDEARMEAIGAVDELNAAIGFAAAAAGQASCFDNGDPLPALLESLQQNLLVAGTELMAPSRDGSGKDLPRLAGTDTAKLETAIDDLTARLPELRNFILPGGTETSARLHLARAVCRRAERRVTTLRRNEDVSPDVCGYLNRLGDLLFILARYANHVAGTADAIWAPRA